MLGLSDIFITPVLISIISLLSLFYANRKYDGIIRQYFLLGIAFKILGAIAIALLLSVIKGDSYYLYQASTSIYENSVMRFSDTLKLFLHDSSYVVNNGQVYRNNYFDNVDAIVIRNPSLLTAKIASLFGMLTFNSYMSITLLFGIFSFIGNWKIFKIFSFLFPYLIKKLSIPLLFLPSFLIWGSALLKDPLILGFTGILIEKLFFILHLKRFRIKDLAILLISVFFILKIKAYIIVAMIPGVIFWIIQINTTKKNFDTVKKIFRPFYVIIVTLVGIGFYLGFSRLDSFKMYSPTKALERIASFQEYTYAALGRQSSGLTQQNTFDIGTIEPSFTGILIKAPIAIFSTFFRPSIFEASPQNILFSIESTLLLFLSLRLLLKTSIRSNFSVLKRNPVVLFFTIFSISLAFIVGISTSNYMTMIRYRLPFYSLFISSVFVLSYYKQSTRQ